MLFNTFLVNSGNKRLENEMVQKSQLEALYSGVYTFSISGCAMAVFAYFIFKDSASFPNVMLTGLILLIMGYLLRSWDAFVFHVGKNKSSENGLKRFSYLAFLTPVTWGILLISAYSNQETHQVLVVLFLGGVAISAIANLSYSKVIFGYLILLFVPSIIKLFYEGWSSPTSITLFWCALFIFVFLLDSARKIHINYIGNLEEKIKSTTQSNSLKNIIYALDQHSIVSVSDLKGTITEVNEKFVQISQYTQEELIGQNHRIVQSGFHPQSFFKEMWRTVAGGKVWHGEIQNKAKHGPLYWVECTIIPQLNKKGKPEGYIAIRTDITKRKALEKKQHQANTVLQIEQKQADKANKAKSEFLSSMSHELRTPLNAILGFSQLLESDADNPLNADQKESVGYILSSGNHLLSLVNDVLELSTIEAGHVELSIEPVQLVELMQDVGALISPLASKANISLQVASSNDIAISADYTKVKQALINLVSNAIKYNKKNGSVTINWAEMDRGTAKISITDTGIGIPADKYDKVFGAFNRLGQENSIIEGTGIGLVVTKNLVELMGGTIGFESIEGQGSTFWIELPIAEIQVLDDTEIPKTHETPEVFEMENKHILYIEDNPANQRLMQSIFDRLPHTLQMVESAELGEELALKEGFDLILMDIHLPGMDGKELTQRLRKTEHYKSRPIIAVTAAAMKHDIEVAEELFDDYVTKPLDIQCFLNILKKNLKS